MTVALPSAPATTVRRNDQSGFTANTAAATAAGVAFYSKRGPIDKPVLLTDTDASVLDTRFGRPSAAVSYAHYGIRHMLRNGMPVWAIRVTNGATYGGSAVSAASVSAISTASYPSSGSPYKATPDADSGIAPTGPNYTKLTFSAALVTLNSTSITLVFDSTAVTVGPVVYSGSSDATMAAIVTAINSAMGTIGSDGLATLEDNDSTSTTNARVIHIYGPSAQQMSVTSAVVTLGASQASIGISTALFFVQAENPGDWSDELGYKLTNADIGTRQVIRATAPIAWTTGAGVTLTINGVACTTVTYTTSNDNTLQLLATAIEAHPAIYSCTVIKKPLGDSNDRELLITMLVGSATPAVISQASTGSPPTFAFTTQVAGVASDGSFDFELYLSSNPTIAAERYRVSLANQVNGSGEQMQITQVVNLGANQSNYARVITNCPTDGSVVIPFNPLTGAISSGITWLSKGLAGALPSASQIAAAYAVFEDTELYPLSLLVNCGYTTISLQQAMKNVAMVREDGTIAILDIPPASQKTQALLTYRLQTMAIDSSYAAAYVPDVRMQDPYTGINLWVPNSAHMAVVYANNDAARGLGKAPAGRNVGYVDTEALRYEYKTKAQSGPSEYDFIFDKQINIISRKGSAFYVMGDTTLQTAQSALSFVSISRLVGFIEAKVKDACDKKLFDPNNDDTVFALTEELNRFLNQFKGDLDRFEVISSPAANTGGVIEQGNRIIDVFLDPTRSIRRILVRSNVTKSGATFVVEEV